MMAGADEPATLLGLCQPMAIAMVTVEVVFNPGLLALFGRSIKDSNKDRRRGSVGVVET